MEKGNLELKEIVVHERSSTASVEGSPKWFIASMAENGSAKKPTDSEGTVVGGTVRYHCGGWSEEVNSCILISYMVYL
jgi:hypothetical protein